jgi:hypothetical protein
MNKIEFDNMGILKQINYINNEIVKGNTITKICENIEKNVRHEIMIGCLNDREEEVDIKKGA